MIGPIRKIYTLQRITKYGKGFYLINSLVPHHYEDLVILYLFSHSTSTKVFWSLFILTLCCTMYSITVTKKTLFMYICSIFRLFLTFNIIIKINDQRLHVTIILKLKLFRKMRYYVFTLDKILNKNVIKSV